MNENEINLIRAYCYKPSANPSVDLLPDDVIAGYLEQWAAVYPYNELQRLYRALISSLQYLVYTDPNLTAGSGSGGSSRTEKIGQVQVTQATTGEYVSRWQKILDDYLDGTIPFSGITVKGKGVISGGVSLKEINRVKANPDNVLGLFEFKDGGGVKKC